jgi:NADH dehydrogenase
MVRHLDCQQTETGKLLVRPTLQLLDYPEVFALGDIAEIYPYKKTIPATAQAAYQQASCLAKNIPALIRGKRLKSFQYLHLGDMLTLGKREGLISSFGINLEGRLADIARRFVYILRLPTLGHRSKVLESWIRNTLLKFSLGLREQGRELFAPKSVRP